MKNLTSTIRATRIDSIAHQTPAARAGSTLTEVLVAMMIASIGLVSVATLFPMSVLRSVKATQITNATDARYNAESMIDLYPALIKSPDSQVFGSIYTFIPGVPATNTPIVDPPWQRLQLLGSTAFVVDPLGYIANRNLNLPPLGNNATQFYNRPEHFYGNDASGGGSPPWPSNPPGIPWSTLPRYPYNCRNQASADALCTLPDSWITQYETIGGTLAVDPKGLDTFGNPLKLPTQITIAGFNLSTPVAGQTNPNPFRDINFPPVIYPQSLPYPAVRVLMFSADGTQAQIRQVTAFSYDAVNNATTLFWTEDINSNGNPDFNVAGPFDAAVNSTEDVNNNGMLDHYPLSQSFLNAVSSNGTVANAVLGKVRIEVQDRRYTWMLTVRQNSPGVASVDVVVFFRRPLGADDISTNEILYQAVFTQGSTQVFVTYPTGVNASGAPLKPYMKRGGFVFEANNGYWYRINNVSDDNNGNAVLTLESPANASTGSPPFFPPRAMFPRGVVDVYPLGAKSIQ